ncbi:hypothetical protein ET495_09980 [Xylanimonas allomyrinae]|uniref:Sulfate permease n=1 Tax=Xylanimonas allomyrinae TaxID=2509459 RepID=A0A4V0YEA4_9MICO|nr:hypothetical protein [Xylanimonas allomyrinae]QAY63521.1 hypothetical protein ET495_09980 [Xylanimonas allomyrinae]
MVVRLGLAAVGGVLGMCQAWLPSNLLVRWIYTDRGLKWGVPIAAALIPAYVTVGQVAQGRIDAGGSQWWWALLAWSLLGALKFLSVGIRTPFVWAVRAMRRRARPHRGSEASA